MLPFCVCVFMPPCGMLEQVKASRGGWISMCTYQGEMRPFLSVRNRLTTSDLLLRLSGYTLASCLAFTVTTDVFPFQMQAREFQTSNFRKNICRWKDALFPRATLPWIIHPLALSMFSRDYCFCGGMPAVVCGDAGGKLHISFKPWSTLHLASRVGLRVLHLSPVQCSVVTCRRRRRRKQRRRGTKYVIGVQGSETTPLYLPFLKVVNLWEVCLSHNCRRSLYLVQTCTRARELTPWSRCSRHRGKKEGNKKGKRKSEGAEGRWTPWGWKSCQTQTCTGGDRRGQTAMEARLGNASGELTPAGGVTRTLIQLLFFLHSFLFAISKLLSPPLRAAFYLEPQINTWLHHAKEEEARLCCLTKLFGVVL